MGGGEAWHDAADFHGDKTKTLECRTVGYLLYETKDRIGIVNSLALHDSAHHDGVAQVSGTMAIPKVAIVERRVLSKGRR